MGKVVSRKKVSGGKKLHVNDSKSVYTPAAGLKELERGVLALSAVTHGWSDDLPALLSRVAGHAAADVADYAWYTPAAGEAFPIEQEAVGVRIQANALEAEMRRGGVGCVHFAARVVCERQFNAMVNATRNKASALFSTAVIHLDHLIRAYGGQDLTIVCDRQGGRGRYGSLLRLMFDEWALEVTDESEGHSEYRLTPRRGRRPHLVPREGRGAVPAGGSGVDAEQVPAGGADAEVQRVLGDAPAGRDAHRRVLHRRATVPGGHRREAQAVGHRRRAIDPVQVTGSGVVSKRAIFDVARASRPCCLVADGGGGRYRSRPYPGAAAMPVEKWSDSVVVVHLGDDPQFTDDLEALDPALSGGRVHAVLDFAAIRFVNSSNLARLLKLRRQCVQDDRRLILCKVGTHVWSTMLVTGLDKVFEFSEDVTTALATLQLQRT